MSKIWFTPHSIRRYIQRHAPDLSYAEAESKLIRHSRRAAPLKEKTINGQEQWRIDSLDIILVVRFGNKNHVCVTVLPEKETESIPEEELQLIREYIEESPTHSDLLTSLDKERCQHNKKLEDNLTDKQRYDLHCKVIRSDEKIAKMRLALAREYTALKQTRARAKDLKRAKKFLEGTTEYQTAQALRAAILGLVEFIEHDNVKDVLRKIGDINPKFLTDDFLQ